MGAGERKEWGWSADGCLMMQLSVLYLMASLFFLNQLFINFVGSLGWVRGASFTGSKFHCYLSDELAWVSGARAESD